MFAERIGRLKRMQLLGAKISGKVVKRQNVTEIIEKVQIGSSRSFRCKGQCAGRRIGKGGVFIRKCMCAESANLLDQQLEGKWYLAIWEPHQTPLPPRSPPPLPPPRQRPPWETWRRPHSLVAEPTPTAHHQENPEGANPRGRASASSLRCPR